MHSKPVLCHMGKPPVLDRILRVRHKTSLVLGFFAILRSLTCPTVNHLTWESNNAAKREGQCINPSPLMCNKGTNARFSNQKIIKETLQFGNNSCLWDFDLEKIQIKLRRTEYRKIKVVKLANRYSAGWGPWSE